eukprot:NODE_25426_length_588_cov_0.904555.p4 GENE.NODE_25426_length_588_cov_0.904555~~NODE_25426_length_588_cov_0.904555.p4  ORF type:complete len:55 (-),score=26.20 NODE_25426_length_588_cov_0.904555:161-325(-)
MDRAHRDLQNGLELHGATQHDLNIPDLHKSFSSCELGEKKKKKKKKKKLSLINI